MGKFTTEAKVGLFVLVGLLLLGYMSFRVGGFEIRRDKGYRIYALFNTASGLAQGVPVEIAGIEVGLVESISLEDGRALVTLRMSPDVPLGIDSRAMIRTKGVLGDKYVDIIPGAKGAPVLKPDNRIVHTQTPAEVDELITKITEISSDIKKVTQSLSEVLGGPEGANNMREILVNFREMSTTMATLIRDNNQQINQMLQNLNAFSEDLKGMSSDNKGNIEAILVSFRAASETMTRTMTALQDITERVNRGEGVLGALVNDDTTVRDMNNTLASLRDISAKINSGQGTIGKLINDTTTADKIDDALSGVNTYLSKTDAFKFYIDYRADWLFEHEDLRSTINVRIQPKADKYYLLGVVADNRGSYKKSERVFTTGGTSVTTVDETRDWGDIRFNAQIAKRYYDLVVRGGLIESAGGLGIDYYLLDDGLKLTFEAFSGEIDRNAHLRFGVTYDFWKYFYVSAGYDDFNSDQGRESGFFGLGLKFYDEDLKYLITSVPIPAK